MFGARGVGQRRAATIRLLPVLLTTTILSAAVVAPSAAQAQTAPGPSSRAVSFSIPAQPLPAAVNAFSRATGWQVGYSSGSVSGKTSRAVSGVMTPQQALAVLISGTGLSVSITGPGTASLIDPGFSPAAAVDGDAVQLEPIDVTTRINAAHGSAKKDEAFKTPAAVTSVDATDIERHGQRSVGDLLRTVPGVFTETSARNPALSINIRGMQDFGRNAITVDGARQNLQVSGHGSNGWVFVDQNLLAGADVQRGIVPTAQGAGVIGGAVNFRTIGVDDVVEQERNWGALGKATIGSNGFGRAVMASGGFRVNENIGVVGAISERTSTDYSDAWGVPVPSTGQELLSGLVKTSITLDDDQRLDLGAVFYNDQWADGSADLEVQVNTFTAAYSYTPLGNNLVDLHINAYHNDALLDQYVVGSRFDTHVEYRDKGTGGNIANTSRFAIGGVALAVEYGAEYYFDAVTTDARGFTSRPIDPAFDGLTPQGDRGVGGVFSQTTLTFGQFDVIGALRYDRYTLTGSGNNQYPGGLVPVGPFEVDKSAEKLSGKGALVYRPLEGVQVYGSYGTGFRPPAVTETLMASNHPGGMTFMRFMPNPFLEPEESKGWEVGANLSFDAFLHPDDRLRLKVGYFDNEVENYITSVWPVGTVPIMYTYMNMTEPARLKGFEFDAHYDVGRFFVGLAYTDTEIDLTPPAAAFGLTLMPPEKVWTGTLGMRFFEERLTLGGRIRFVSESERFYIPSTNTRETVPEYRLVDAFAEFKLSDHATAFLTGENLTNQGYVIAKDNSSQYGPGRTIMGGFSTKF